MLTRRIGLASLAAISMTLVGGCESHEEVALDPVPQTPLSLDPTQDFAMAPWWVSTDHILFLDDTGHYRLYEGTSRYQPPIERGLWSRANYATLRLQPYSSGAEAMIRQGKFTRTGSGLVLSLPEFAPLAPRSIAPQSIEDELIGSWTGDLATLELNSNMEYSLTSVYTGAAPITSTTRHGVWRYDKAGDVVLGQDDLRLRIQRDDEDEKVVGLNGPHLALKKATRTAGG